MKITSFCLAIAIVVLPTFCPTVHAQTLSMDIEQIEDFTHDYFRASNIT